MKYRVWCLDRGEHEEDGRVVMAETPRAAAEAWAEFSDWSGADYVIVNGAIRTVSVRDEAGEVTQYTVRGYAVPTYRAELLP